MPSLRSSSAIATPTLYSALGEGNMKVVRKFINAAVYVEKPIMPPCRKTSPVLVGSVDSGYISSRTSRPRSQVSQKKSGRSIVSVQSPSNPSESSTSSDEGSQVTVKSNNVDEQRDGNISDLRLSLCSLPSTTRTGNIDPKEKEEMIKSWMQKKNKERQKREVAEAKQKEEKEKQRQMMLEKEKENYQKWLARKKMQEERIKKEKEKKEKEKEMREKEKEKKKMENETTFAEWLKKKKRVELEKKIKDKLALLKLYEEKQRRIDENEKAFDEWLKTSKDKPRPIPLNKGLESLCSSTSVTYINPIPWIPNVENARKPSSQ